MSDTLRLLEDLIARRSVTPEDAGCQAVVEARLTAAGFRCTTLPAGPDAAQVQNLWAVHAGGAPGPLIVLAGHTDVVPTGPLERWTSDPFVPNYRDGRLYGRGAADMKTSVAAMVVAAEEFVHAQPQHGGSIALLLTSDEEGPAIDGTLHVVNTLKDRGVVIDACIVGESTSVDAFGDTIKNGRRGSLTGRLRVIGVQGHVAYPLLARNPVHEFAPALAELAATVWDAGDAHFPPTSWQVSNIHAGTGAGNVIPGEAVVDFNFRFSTASTPDGLKQRVEALLRKHRLQYELSWTLGAEPFLTAPGRLSRAISEAIRAETGLTPLLSTTGGTSDGRYIARICPQVIEFGPINASIHQIDEHVDVTCIEPLKNIYRRSVELMLS
jgi:succinyl-diaminopimelate desuccinylase